MLSCVDIGMRFGEIVALTDIDFSIDACERVAILGPSGAGKTTLLRIAAGMIAPTTGACRIFGHNRTDLSGRQGRAIRADVGFVPQDHALVPTLRVVHNVLTGALSRQSTARGIWRMLRPGTRVSAVHKLLEQLGVGEKIFERTGSLSGGEMQRVALARALYQSPRLLLLDEPVASVDPARADEIMGLLTTLAQRAEMSLFISLHDPQLARQYCTRIIGLRGGRTLFDRAADDVTDDELHMLYRTADA